jgi:hypothetical protein
MQRSGPVRECCPVLRVCVAGCSVRERVCDAAGAFRAPAWRWHTSTACLHHSQCWGEPHPGRGLLGSWRRSGAREGLQVKVEHRDRDDVMRVKVPRDCVG